MCSDHFKRSKVLGQKLLRSAWKRNDTFRGGQHPHKRAAVVANSLIKRVDQIRFKNQGLGATVPATFCLVSSTRPFELFK